MRTVTCRTNLGSKFVPLKLNYGCFSNKIGQLEQRNFGVLNKSRSRVSLDQICLYKELRNVHSRNRYMGDKLYTPFKEEKQEIVDNRGIIIVKSVDKGNKSLIHENRNQVNNLVQPREKAIDEVNKDIGLSKFLVKVYNYTGLGIAGSIGTSLLMDLSGIAMMYPIHSFVIGAILSFGSIFGLHKGSTDTIEERYEGQIIKVSRPDPTSILSYIGLVTGMGITMGPFVSMCHSIDPLILPIAFGLSCLTFMGSSLYAYFKPSESLSYLKGPLMGALTGFVGMSLLSLGSTLIFGPTLFSDIWMNIDMYAGIGLFSAFIAYDTHAAIEEYNKNSNPNPIAVSTNMFLDFMNILIRFMEILAKIKKNN